MNEQRQGIDTSKAFLDTRPGRLRCGLNRFERQRQNSGRFCTRNIAVGDLGRREDVLYGR